MKKNKTSRSVRWLESPERRMKMDGYPKGRRKRAQEEWNKMMLDEEEVDRLSVSFQWRYNGHSERRQEVRSS